MTSGHPVPWKKFAEEKGFKTVKEMLHTLYIKQGFSLVEMGTLFNCSAVAVRAQMIKRGVPCRRAGRRVTNVR